MKKRACASFAVRSLLLLAAPAFAGDSILVSSRTGLETNHGVISAAGALVESTFQFAHDNVAAGGEVQVMDPGDYQPVHITKAISIVNDGAGPAGVLQVPASGEAIRIDAGASDKVVLRGLDVEGGDVGPHGVNLNVAGSLNIARCVFRGFQNGGAGVYIAATSATTFSIADTIVSNNNQGIRVWP